jgi:lysophospholipase L1-like esterase
LNALWPRAVFWLLLPVMAAQGLWLRRQATRLPGAAGERQGVVGDGMPLHLLALGDSIIDGVGTGQVAASLPVQFAEAVAERLQCRVHWRVEGASGHDAEAVRGRLDSLEPGVPADVVLLSVGVNDVTGLSGTRHWRNSLQHLFGGIRDRWPNALVLFAGLPPMAQFPLPPQPLKFSLGLRAATLDGIARSLVAQDARAVHVPTRIDPLRHDFCADGFHPSAESCTLWARELAKVLAEALAGNRAGTPSAAETRRIAQ